MPDAATVRSTIKAGHGVTVHCTACGHSRPLDLVEMERRGHSDTALLGLPLRCQCGSRRYRVTVAGSVQWERAQE